MRKVDTIYLASSWRNEEQPAAVATLRREGFRVYDFRNPAPGERGFSWSDCDESWKSWTPAEFCYGLGHPIAQHGFALDMTALQAADACVLLAPCGRSAHLELGFAVGAGKPTAVVLAPNQEPELMYSMCSELCLSVDEAAGWLARLRVREATDGSGPTWEIRPRVRGEFR